MADSLAEDVGKMQINGNSESTDDATDLNMTTNTSEFSAEEMYKLALHFYKGISKETLISFGICFWKSTSG